MAFEIYGEDLHRYDFGPEKHWLRVGLGGLLIGKRRYWEKPWDPDFFFFYPEAHELRELLAKLEADPTPIVEIGLDLETAFGILRDFVKTYETACIDTTPWEPIYLW